MAGKRLGKEDDRHLWPEMLRVIREVRPRWVVGENVLGLVNWNGGLVFHEVQTDLEAEGYEVQPYVLPAAAVGAPHRRDRVWFVAHSIDNNRSCAQSNRNEKGEFILGQSKRFGEKRTIADTDSNGQQRSDGEYEKQPSERGVDAQRDIEPGVGDGDVAYANGIGWDEGGNDGRYIDVGERKREFSATNSPQDRWRKFPTKSPICGGNDGLPDKLDGITFSKWRAESIKAGGNAVVPQVVLQIFRTIEEYEKTHAQ
jgi:DNA (cytosine-5)-methyltransferase 1